MRFCSGRICVVRGVACLVMSKREEITREETVTSETKDWRMEETLNSFEELWSEIQRSCAFVCE